MSTIASTHDDTYSQRSSSTQNDHRPREEEDSNEVRMTDRYFKTLFRNNFGLYYNTFELNEKLYLHYKGFTRIENLEKFPDLKCIYLEGNGFTKIEGLDTNVKIRSLYIQENLFEKIENLNHLKDLHYLNLNDNYITTIENLAGIEDLNTLQIKKNKVGKNGLSDVMGLLDVLSLSVLDISENFIDDPAIIEEVFAKMPNLKVLYLKGNPVCKKIKYYKKTVIAKLPQLTYLDDSPVFPEDRRYAEAFYRGGMPEEREERKKIKKEKDDEHWRNHNAFREMIRKAKERKQQEEAKKAELKKEKDQEQENEQQLDQESSVQPEKEEKLKTENEKMPKEETKEELKEEVKEESDDLPPELEEVTPEQLAKEQEQSKVKNLIDQLASKQPEVVEEEKASDKSHSTVDVNDINVDNSNSINLSVTSETSDPHKVKAEDSLNHSRVSESEEEKHLEDSASDAEESAKTEPGQAQDKLNGSQSSNLNHSNQKPHDDDGDYLDELD
ncbi:unnamed protein product [Moneuplotes crassus]|uniref:Dynein assembly factor 1, axonemal homolog n=1 Tax=Euplotes crassus TaxID=5936 RepID=A0AAD1XDN2_EUPCR|nr:unnamed protein product [Moneuplotes crassus]